MDPPGQRLKDKPGKHEALQRKEDAPPPTGAEERKRVASSYKASTGVGADGFHPKVPLDSSNGILGDSVVFLPKVEQCGDGLVQPQHVRILFAVSVSQLQQLTECTLRRH